MNSSLLRSAFKFLPVIGAYIADCFEGKGPAELREKWKLDSMKQVDGPIFCNDGSRRGPPRRQLPDDERFQAKL